MYKRQVDEHLDAPPAIFTVWARQVGRAPLLFSVWQDGAQIASVTHHVQVIDSTKQPATIIDTESYTVPVQDVLAEIARREEEKPMVPPPYGLAETPEPSEPAGCSSKGGCLSILRMLGLASALVLVLLCLALNG